MASPSPVRSPVTLAVTANRIRLAVFLYTLLWFLLLCVIGGWYIIHPDAFTRYASWGTLALSVWFAMLGGVAISFKGVYEHYQLQQWLTGGWTLWYVGRPLSGAIVGVMVYVLLRVVNKGSDLPIEVLAVAAFTLGLQEKRFFTFLQEVANLVLTVPKDLQPVIGIKQIDPNRGAPGIPVLITGGGLKPGCKITLGGEELTGAVLSADGTAAAGTVPAKLTAGSVDVVATNLDGTAYTLRQGFTVTVP